MFQKCYNFNKEDENKMKKIVIASDHGGFELKNKIINHLQSIDIQVQDCGCFNSESCDYPFYANKVAELVLNEKVQGILVCGTGIGMSIACNKVKGVSDGIFPYLAILSSMKNPEWLKILC